MTGVLASLITDGVGALSGPTRMLLIVPLCLSIAIVYKTTRCDSVREVPTAAASLCVTIVVGMYVVAIGLWILFNILA